MIAVVAAVVVLLGVGAVVALVLRGDDAKPAFCSVLDEPGGRTVFVYVEADADPATARAIGDELAEIDGVQGLVYVDRDESFEEAKQIFADQPTMRELLRSEDIPTSWRFGVTDDATEASARAAVEGRDAVLDISVSTEQIEDDLTACA